MFHLDGISSLIRDKSLNCPVPGVLARPEIRKSRQLNLIGVPVWRSCLLRLGNYSNCCKVLSSSPYRYLRQRTYQLSFGQTQVWPLRDL